MTLICEKVLTIEGLQAATAMKRMPNSDDIVLGCYRDILILRFTGDDFLVLNTIKDVHTGKYSSLNILIFRPY